MKKQIFALALLGALLTQPASHAMNFNWSELVQKTKNIAHKGVELVKTYPTTSALVTFVAGSIVVKKFYDMYQLSQEQKKRSKEWDQGVANAVIAGQLHYEKEEEQKKRQQQQQEQDNSQSDSFDLFKYIDLTPDTKEFTTNLAAYQQALREVLQKDEVKQKIKTDPNIHFWVMIGSYSTKIPLSLLLAHLKMYPEMLEVMVCEKLNYNSATWNFKAQLFTETLNNALYEACKYLIESANEKIQQPLLDQIAGLILFKANPYAKHDAKDDKKDYRSIYTKITQMRNRAQELGMKKKEALAEQILTILKTSKHEFE